MGLLGTLWNGAMNAAREVDSEGGIYAPGRGREYDYLDVDQIPREMGTYRVLQKVDSGRNIVYIGISVNLRRRIKEHQRTENFKPDEIVAIKIANSGTTYEELCEHERKKIEIHNPIRNRKGGGGGRRPELDIDHDLSGYRGY